MKNPIPDSRLSIASQQQVGVSLSEKETLEQESRERLFADLLQNRIEFSSFPYEAHIQYSNYCNMSCIMCWDGNNPPTKKTPPEMLEKIGRQLGPHLSIVTPYSGSEPLVLTWEETQQMARDYGILLCITTNVQFLTEARFHELKDITETLIMSIDSHIPAVFEKIRPRGNSKKVFANLESAARLCNEHNLESIVNVVFMTQNAPMLSDTLNYLADIGIQNVNIIQLLDVNGNSRMYDPLLHFSDEYVAWIKSECIAVAKKRQFRLIWSIAGYAEYDYRGPEFVPTHPRKHWNDQWDMRMKLFFPGFCRNAYNRLRVDSEGDVAPCCYATEGELSLGNLNETDFDSIWNGSEARDLRRGMLTNDVPALCQSCRFHDVIPPQPTLPFVETEEERSPALANFEVPTSLPSLEIIAPDHAARSIDPVPIQIRQPPLPVREFVLMVSLGGEDEEVHRSTLQPTSQTDEALTFAIPNETWNQLKPNVGYWWMVWAIPELESQRPLRCAEARCVIRHQPLPRIADSTLRYADRGFVPVSDLGGGKQEGWSQQENVPQRPLVALNGRHSSPGPVPQPINQTQSSPLRAGSMLGWINQLVGSEQSKQPQHGIADGYLDVAASGKSSLKISGWIMLVDGPAESVEVVGLKGDTVVATVFERADVADQFPQHADAINAGYEVVLEDDLFWQQDCYRFAIVAKRNGRVEFRCNVTCRGSAAPKYPLTSRSLRAGSLDF